MDTLLAAAARPRHAAAAAAATTAARNLLARRLVDNLHRRAEPAGLLLRQYFDEHAIADAEHLVDRLDPARRNLRDVHERMLRAAVNLDKGAKRLD